MNHLYNVLYRYRKRMIKTQYDTFWSQNLSSFIIYVPLLIATSLVINNKPDWVYSQTVIFDNPEFNLTIGIIVFTGFASVLLAYKPDCIKCYVEGENARKNVPDNTNLNM